MKIPSEAEITALHRKYAASDAAYQAVYTHCRIVWDIAQQLIEKYHLPVDTRLVKAGCLLHDIGIYRFEGAVGGSDNIGAEYIRHGQYGYEILRGEGLPEAICRFAAHHTGVGISKDEIIANKLPLPHQDFLAETPEERLVMYADKFNSKSTPPRFNSPASYRTYVARYGKHKVEAFDRLAQEFGTPDLTPLSQKYTQPIL